MKSYFNLVDVYLTLFTRFTISLEISYINKSKINLVTEKHVSRIKNQRMEVLIFYTLISVDIKHV